MNSLKKPKKNAISKFTLDIHHSKYIEKMDHISNEIKECELEIERVQKLIDYSKDDKDQYLFLTDKLYDLNSKLKDLKKEFDESTYYTNTADILFKYYDIIEKGDNKQVNSINNIPENSILSYFTNDKVCQTKTKDVENESNEENKGELFSKYIHYVEKDYLPEMEKAIDKCDHCGSADLVVMNNEGFMFCSSCNNMEFVIIDHEKPSYKDPPKEVTCFSYKRINHFNEWLSKIQAKETTDIPDEVYDKILLEIKKQRITNMAEINCTKIKNILKTLKKNKYYEHIAHIIYRLNGVPTPNLSVELEEKLRNMFKQIQIPFWKHSPPKRKNFLSYSYVLHKMIQLLEKDEYLDCFQLLRSREKLAAQDAIWKKICNDLGWQFYPSL